jgi:anti-sigma factor (TIGR02949 family)
MTPCNRAMRRLWEYLDDEMPRAEAECMRHHLAGCPTCGPHAVFEQRLLDRIAAVRSRCGDIAAVRRRIIATLAFQTILPDWKDG